MNINKIAYYLTWSVKRFVLRKKIPLAGGIVITDRCNLKCKHCVVAHLGRGDASFKEISSYLDQLFRLGVRALFVVGGEPFIWKDGEYDLNSIVELAKEKDFFSVSICTNGTYSLETEADILWVSIDGLKRTHDKIRGRTFDKIVTNIRKSGHKRIFVNFTINNLNYKGIKDFLRFVRRNNKIKGVLVNFHTPYPGVEDLLLSPRKRASVINLLLRLKREGYPICNSVSGLRALKEDNWERPVWMCRLVDLGRVYTCCCRSDIVNQDVCRNCGCAIAVEASQVAEGRISAILESFRYF